MKTTIELWTIHKLIDLQERINLRPKFQRGPAWGDRQRYLLIDSIIRGYDIPKLYLNVLKKGRVVHSYDYEVEDGQQRLRAIFDFTNDVFPIGPASAGIDGQKLTGRHFSELSSANRRHFLNYKTTVALLEEASREELQSLFARLQMGVVLNPPELRNALCSVIGAVIEVAALTHPFFENAGIANKRFKRQDYLCHALALTTYNNKEDLKAPLLKRFYEDGLAQYDDALINRASTTLDWMDGLDPKVKKLLRNKWAFVDTFDLLLRNFDLVSKQQKKTRLVAFGREYMAFEAERRANTKHPEKLLAHSGKRQMYNYTVAFKTTPATKGNIARRRAALDHHFSVHFQ